MFVCFFVVVFFFVFFFCLFCFVFVYFYVFLLNYKVKRTVDKGKNKDRFVLLISLFTFIYVLGIR